MAADHLAAAKRAKNDEFYTQWVDIEREMNAYLEYDPDVFRGKTILLPCDDPEWSNFVKFFALHFEDYGLKRLIATSYAPASKGSDALFDDPTEIETGAPQYDPELSRTHGRVFELTGEDLTGDGRIDLDDLQWRYLDSDGDFRSAEVTALRDEADFVITNPPFSLFREFLAWVTTGGTRFSVIGNKNAITFKEVFPLIKANLMWLGATGGNTDMVFRVPEGAEVRPSDRQKAARMGYEGNFTRLGNACWFTNIDHGRRHQPLQLMTVADNLRYSRHKELRGAGAYPRYANYDAIEVSWVDAIPADHDGVMGVPITFLDKYDPEQFEIVGRSHDLEWATSDACSFYVPESASAQKEHRRANKTWRTQIGYLLDADGKAQTVYQRLFIRHKNPAPKEPTA